MSISSSVGHVGSLYCLLILFSPWMGHGATMLWTLRSARANCFCQPRHTLSSIPKELHNVRSGSSSFTVDWIRVP